MPADEHPSSRYLEVSRRAFLQRSARLGVALAVPGALLAACSSDQAVFSQAAVSSTTTDTADSSSTSSTATATEATPTTTEAAAGTVPSAAAMTVDFTYEASSTDGRGGVKNPYIAVWIEDASGDLVATVALWFLQSDKGTQWLSDLRRWSTVDGSNDTVDTISSATRRPGTYSLLWNCQDADGQLVTQGDYYIAIEAAREHGPYSLIREPITLGSEGFVLGLDTDGELTDAVISYDIA